MSRRAVTHALQQEATEKTAGLLLQRKCACGAHTIGGASCDDCAGEGRKLKRAAVNRAEFVNRAEASDAQPDTQTLSHPAHGFAHDFSLTPLRSVSSPSPQSKLAVSSPGDEYEREADAFAEHVMSMNAPAALTHELTHVARRVPAPVVQRQPKEAPAQEPKEPVEPEGEVVNAREFAKAESLIRIRQQLNACQQAGLGRTNSGVTAQSPVDGQTAQLLDEMLERAAFCGSLSQYITLKPQKLSQGHFAVHQHYRGNENLSPDDASRSRFDTDDFHAAVAKYLGFTGGLTDAQRAQVRKVGGFYDRSRDTVNLPSTGLFGSALHESVHRLSGVSFQQLFGHFLNEGVTQCFADIILQDEGLPVYTGHEYGPNVQSARLLITRLGGWTLLAQVYFQSSQDAYWQAMVNLGLIPSVEKRRFISSDEVLRAISITQGQTQSQTQGQTQGRATGDR
jgi:hypothetical protein